MNYIICLIFISICAAMRVVEHAPNFTPIISVALLSGFYIKNRFLILLPIGSMFLSDIFIGSHGVQFWVYLPLMIIFAAGYFIKNNNVKNVFVYSVLSSVVFFVVSNFGVWVMGGYTYDFSGFVACYVMAVPFFKNTLLSTVIFSLLFHYSFKFLSSFEKQAVNTTV